MLFIEKAWVSSSSFKLASLHIWPEAPTKRLQLLWLTLDKRICPQGHKDNHSHVWAKPTDSPRKSLHHPLSCLLIILPSAGRQRAPLNAKLDEVGTTFITGQLAEADIIYTDSIPYRDNPPWQRLTAVWFPRHSVLKRQVDLFKFSFSRYMLTTPRESEKQKKPRTFCLRVQHKVPALPVDILSIFRFLVWRGASKTLPCI